ncbi:hypothetical protein FS749_002987 [Ceratobasidium sp. UAMH 11750]|nr:hypothetical protein FS749_002987 [Ceratobasidium sp. UAMH 11750]
MWGLKNWMLVILLLAFIVSQLPSTVLGLIAGQKIVVVENPLPGVLTGCTTSSHASHKSNWISVYLGTIAFEATLFALTLLQAWILHRDGANTPIITLLTRDGAWYFLVRISSPDPPFAAHDPFFYVLMRIQAALVSVSLVAIGTTIPKTRPAAFFSHTYMALKAPPTARVLFTSYQPGHGLQWNHGRRGSGYAPHSPTAVVSKSTIAEEPIKPNVIV